MALPRIFDVCCLANSVGVSCPRLECGRSSLYSLRQSSITTLASVRFLNQCILGAALTGLIDETALLASVRSEAELAKAAWALGMRDESRRDYRGALRMYQLARTSQQASDARSRALAAATRIHDLDTSLDVLEAEPALGAVVAAGP
jgi:hypothetical protein